MILQQETSISMPSCAVYHSRAAHNSFSGLFPGFPHPRFLPHPPTLEEEMQRAAALCTPAFCKHGNGCHPIPALSEACALQAPSFSLSALCITHACAFMVSGLSFFRCSDMLQSTQETGRIAKEQA